MFSGKDTMVALSRYQSLDRSIAEPMAIIGQVLGDPSYAQRASELQGMMLKTKGAEAPCTALLGWFYGGFLKWSSTGDIFSHGVTFY